MAFRESQWAWSVACLLVASQPAQCTCLLHSLLTHPSSQDGVPACICTSCPSHVAWVLLHMLTPTPTSHPPTPPTPSRRYIVSAQAVVNNKPIPASNTMPLQMPAPGAPTLVDAQARSSVRGFALAAPPAGGSCDSYVYTFAPVNGGGAGGQPVVREVTGTSINVDALSPATTYDVSVQCKKGGQLSGPSNVKQVGVGGAGTHVGKGKPALSQLLEPCVHHRRLSRHTLTCLTPTLPAPQIVTAAPDAPSNQGTPTSPVSARIQLNPPQALPPSGSPWARYQLTVCPVRGPAAACVRRTCTTLTCAVTGLAPATTYVVQTVAVAEDGSLSVPSNEAPFTTPSLAA